MLFHIWKKQIFQSTLPRRERLLRPSLHLCRLYFNPRSRGGSDQHYIDLVREAYYISIHAPAEGATQIYFVCFHCSIFQSTLPRRERLRVCSWLRLEVNISIHAPAEGATSAISCAASLELYFNPRSRGGSDSLHTLPASELPYFNPRSRGGSDVWHCVQDPL